MALTREEFNACAQALYDFCDLPAVKYKVLSSFLDVPYEDDKLAALRPGFLYSDIMEELYREQDRYGGWGPLFSKDYSVKAKFPTSATAINRCLYIGLTLEDREILSAAKQYLEDILTGRGHGSYSGRNERAYPWGRASVCCLLESISPHNSLCDGTWQEWYYIAGRAYEDGEYSYERERSAQHEVFLTHEDRLIPMQTELLLKRRAEVPPSLEEAMLRRYGEYVYNHGHFWNMAPAALPENFVYNKTRRWFYSFNYINQFRGSALYLERAVEWLMANGGEDGLWDWGTQIKDPWGYFCYFSTSRDYRKNRKADCTVEVLSFLKEYLDRNKN